MTEHTTITLDTIGMCFSNFPYTIHSGKWHAHAYTNMFAPSFIRKNTCDGFFFPICTFVNTELYDLSSVSFSIDAAEISKFLEGKSNERIQQKKKPMKKKKH